EFKRERRGHFRGKSRPGRRVAVRFRLDDGKTGEMHDAHTKNVGVGGAFILSTHPPPPGSTLQLELQIPNSHRPLELAPNARWTITGKRNEPADEHGMGVKFSGLDVDQLLVLNEYFATLTSTVDLDEA